MPITVTITHPDPALTHVSGFNSLWAWYVSGFRPAVHCQACLEGERSARMGKLTTPLGAGLIFDEHPFNQLYICGLASGPESGRRDKNLHLALKEITGAEFEHQSYNGFRFVIRNAERLLIPEPDPRLAHLGSSHCRCCNFRFGTRYYGYPGLSSST